jgi:NifU-like protein
MWDYTEKVKNYFEEPRNVGEVENPDGVGEVGSLACGDALRLTFKLDDKDRIADAKFQTFGCASAIASSSALTEMIIGKTIEEASKVTNQDIVDFLGGMPKEKMHCSVMGMEALQAAIAYYRGEKPAVEEGEIICKCFGITDKEIERVVRDNHLTTREEVTNYTKAGGGCEQCHDKIQAIIDRILAEQQQEQLREKARTGRKLTNIQKIRLIEDTLQREVKPALEADGGDIELIDVEGSKVYVALRGACSACTAAEVTLKQYVEAKLREFVTDDIVVEEVKS